LADFNIMTSNDNTLKDKIGAFGTTDWSQRAMADEAVRAPALGGVTERLDAQDDAHGADDDDVPITRSEGTKQEWRMKYEMLRQCIK